MNIQCLKCKGRGYCGRSLCPRIANLHSQTKAKELHSKKDFFGEAPSPFVGRFGYPNINLGILTPPQEVDNAWEYDAPKHWASNSFQIPEIVDLRSALLNSRFKTKVDSVRDSVKMVDITQEVGLASKPVELEMNIKDKPRFRLQADSVAPPTGPNADMIKAQVTSNSKITRHVDKVHSDTDLKATGGIKYLYEKGYDENFLSKMLSVGTMGLKNNRKLVPTRWSITATDDTIGKQLMNDIRFNSTINDYEVYIGDYLGNYYIILLFPGCWGYELFETFVPTKNDQMIIPEFTTDHENHLGRKGYATNCAGGYYTTKLAVLEHFKNTKRIGTAIAIRVITGDYAMPLGVWVTREASRNSMNSKPMRFASKELMIKYVNELLKKKFSLLSQKIIDSSVLIKDMKQQRRLFEF